MSNPTNRSRFSMAIAAALGIVMTTLASPTHAVVSPVAVVSANVSGAVVNVTVRNTSMLSQVATVKVQAVVGGTAVWSLVPVVLLPGQTMVAGAGFAANVSSLVRVTISCGIQDDGVPI